MPLGELWAQLFQALRDPEAPRPDLVALPSHWTPQLARLGLLRELSALEPAFDPAACPAPLRAHACLPDGKAYSLPWLLEVPALLCRRDILERRGLEPEALTTADAFRRACRVLAKGAGGRALLKGPGSLRWRDAAPFVWARGGEFFSEEGRALFAREEALRGLEDLFDLLSSGALVLAEDTGLPASGVGEGGCVFELASLEPEGPYADRVAAVPFPGGGAPLLSALHLAVPSDCARPDEAWSLARALAPVPGPLPEVRTLPALPLSGTLERILERALERLSVLALEGRCSRQALKEEAARAAQEADAVSAQHA